MSLLNKFSMVKFALIFLVASIMVNINGIVYLFSGINGLISPLILLFSLYILIYVHREKKSLIIQFFLGIYLVYIILGLTSLVVNSDEIGDRAQQTILDILKSVILTISVYYGFIDEVRKTGDKIIKLFAWSIIISVILSYLFYLTGISDNITRYRTQQRLSGVFANPNELAAQSLFSLIMIKYLYKNIAVKNIKLYKLLLTISALISFIVMVMAFSRSILLVFFILLIIQYAYYSKMTISSISSIGLIILVIFFAAPMFYNSADLSLQKRIDSSLTLFDGEVNDENTGGRLELAGHAFDLISDKPFLGLGMGYMQKMQDYGGVHNAYLAIWGNGGIGALISLSLGLFCLLFVLFKFSKKSGDNTFLFLLVVIILNGFTKTGVFEFKINNVVIGLSMALIYLNKYHRDSLAFGNRFK